MGLRLSIAKRWRAAARMLALAAAIAMAFGVQPPHASATQADGPHNSSHQGIASHSHFGASCLQAELDRPQAESNGAVAPGHADCSQVFTPLLRPVATAAPGYVVVAVTVPHELPFRQLRSEEHTSELQSLMRISYAVFCLN